MKIVEARALDVAVQQAAAANAIVSDPNVDPRLAAPHLQRAWRALGRAFGEAGAPEQWIVGAPLPGLNSERRAALAREVEALTPLVEGGPEGLVGAPVPAPRVWLRHVDALLRLCATVAEPAKAPWFSRAALWSGAALSLSLVTVRPWEADALGPWRAAYYASEHFDGKPILRRYANIDFHWGTSAPHDVVPGDLFSAYFDTCLTLEQGAEVAFQVVSDDGARVFLDGKRIIDNWGKHAAISRGATLDVQPGVHHLRIKYFEDTREAELHLMASFDPDEPPAQIPASMLRYPSGSLDDANPCSDEE